MTFTRIIRLRNNIAAFWKRSLSFLKDGWELTDYPVVIREQLSLDPMYKAPRFKHHRFIAYIVNWTLNGFGDTRLEAMRDLQAKFDSTKQDRSQNGKPLPRPGVSEPIEFASQERVSQNQDLSEDFVRRVLNLDWAWISDESSLWDFHTEETNELLHAKILEVYGVDVSHIESAKLPEILDRIAAKRAPTHPSQSALTDGAV